MLTQINLKDGPGEWERTLSLLPKTCQDIYFTPEYSLLHAQEDPGRALCLKYQEGEQIWAFPVLRNPIQKIGTVALPSGLFDLESAYGYGGPLSNSEDDGFLKRANQAFVEWAEQNGIITQFIRFHPLLGNERWIKDVHLEKIFDRFTLSTAIDKYDPGQPFYPKTTRNIIGRAGRLGLEARLLDVDQGFLDFQELYRLAMERLGAETYLFFDPHYFERLRLLVKERGFLIGAFHQQKMIGAAVFFYGPYWLHYHLSASNFDNRLPGVTNIILDLAFQEAKSKALRQVHLGGGRTPDSEDSLLKFKKSMSTDMHSFYIGKRIYNLPVYKDLVTTWKQEFPTLVQRYQARLLSYHYSL
jgi:hypothetical protein